MKKAIVFLILLAAGTSFATIYPKVYMADGITPLELADTNVPYVYRDITVGTKLIIVLESDSIYETWDGILVTEDANMNYGILSGGTNFPEAGMAMAYPWYDFGICFTLYDGMPGNWFAVDYDALATGKCCINLYEFLPPPSEGEILLKSLIFNQIPTGDFNEDSFVNYSDFAILASYWQQTGLYDPSQCQGADLDNDFDVDLNDLMLFSNYWLEKTKY
jgi:hypothetical protein